MRTGAVGETPLLAEQPPRRVTAPKPNPPVIRSRLLTLRGTVQAFRVGESVYVTQFHPELDAERLIARMGIYADAGYFDPDDFDALSASARAADVGDQPALILANFVARFAQP